MTSTPGSDVPTDETTVPPEGRVLRFTAAERWVHHATALLMIIVARCFRTISPIVPASIGFGW